MNEVRKSVKLIEEAATTSNNHLFLSWFIARAFNDVGNLMDHWVMDLSMHALTIENHRTSFDNAQLTISQPEDKLGDTERSRKNTSKVLDVEPIEQRGLLEHMTNSVGEFEPETNNKFNTFHFESKSRMVFGQD